MSERNSAVESEAGSSTLEEIRFEATALPLWSRRQGFTALAMAAAVGVSLVIPWSEHLRAEGRVVPHRWARVQAEAPGVVREIRHRSGDVVAAGDIIAVLDFDPPRDADSPLLPVRFSGDHPAGTPIHAPLSGTLVGAALAMGDEVAARDVIGVVEDTSHLSLKLLVDSELLERIEIGQPVKSVTLDGSKLQGRIVWKVPRAGLAVRDLGWNVLVQLEGDLPAVEPKSKTWASIDVGRRSFLNRWRDAPAAADRSRTALIEDPTELHDPLGTLSASRLHQQLAAELARAMSPTAHE